MEAFLQVFFSGLTMGAMYALSAVGLALLWGVVGMLNMAQGAMLAIGGYASYTAVIYIGLPWPFGLPAGILAGFVTGVMFYYTIVHWLYRSPTFEVNVIIATVGASILIESLIIKIFSGYPVDQPFSIQGGVRVSTILLPWQTLLNIGIAFIMMLVLAWILRATRLGRAIRATAQHRTAAQLMGVPVGRVFIQVLIIAGVVAAISGVLLTGSVANLLPQVGTGPMLKAFFICVIAGLGNIPGAVLAAFVLAEFEAGIQYLVGGRYGFPAMFVLAMIVLIFRPHGVFGKRRVTRA